jgi:regulator of cell morphogenesis and NO signaling
MFRLLDKEHELVKQCFQPFLDLSKEIIISIDNNDGNLFKENLIDFCCGGNRSLVVVLQQQKLEEKPFIEKLNQMYTEVNKVIDLKINWLQASSSDLINHVVATHHTYLQKELPLLSEFVNKILSVHGANHGEVLSKLHQLFHLMKTELDQHLIAEEQTVFPLIIEYDLNPSPILLDQLTKAIVILETDHGGVGDFLKKMRVVTHDYALPPEACRTYTLTFQKLECLEADLFQHIHLENNILFPRFS